MKNLNNYIKSINFSSLIYCLVFTLTIRFPYFFRDVINWDESTFILTGQSLLDGSLPYTHIWDLKPPLLPGAFALFILLFGKSIISMRVAGAVCVALTSWFVFLIGKMMKGTRAGLIGATLSVLSLSALNFRFFATMSEHVAIVPLVGALLLLVCKRVSPIRLFWVGVLLSTATMIRLNLAYVALIAGFFAVAILDHEQPLSWQIVQNIVIRMVSYAAGVLLIIILTFLPYLFTGQALIWWDSVILAPLNYSVSEFTAPQALYGHLERISDLVFNWEEASAHYHLLATIIFPSAVIGACICVILLAFRKFSAQEKRSLSLLTIFFLSVVFSILSGGQVFTHYWIQIMPFLALFAMFAHLPAFTKNRWKVALPVAIVIIFFVFPRSEYRLMIDRMRHGDTLTHGTGYEIADYFKDIDDLEDKSVYMMTGHIAYWLIDQYPLTKSSTHPSNISKEYLLEISIGPGATPDLALSEILEQEPDYIVARLDASYLRQHDSLRLRLGETLENQYEWVHDVQNGQIYKRVKGDAE